MLRQAWERFLSFANVDRQLEFVDSIAFRRAINLKPPEPIVAENEDEASDSNVDEISSSSDLQTESEMDEGSDWDPNHE